MSWTITPTINQTQTIKHALYGNQLVVLKLACTCDDSAASGSITLKSTKADRSDTYCKITDQIEGSTLYLMEVVPGTGGAAPTGTFDIDVENNRNNHILDTDSNSNTANSFVIGSNTLGIFPPIFSQITVVVGDLGDANTVDIYLYFWK